MARNGMAISATAINRAGHEFTQGQPGQGRQALTVSILFRRASRA
jgi:hypothetical protein